MLEPRGHAGMHGALLTEPVSPNAHAGVLFMHGAGFPTLSGEGVIGAVTIALEHGLIAGAGEELLLDTPAGLVRTRLGCDRCDGCETDERFDDRSPLLCPLRRRACRRGHSDADGRRRLQRRALRDCRQRGRRNSYRDVQRIAAHQHGDGDQGCVLGPHAAKASRARFSPEPRGQPWQTSEVRPCSTDRFCADHRARRARPRCWRCSTPWAWW